MVKHLLNYLPGRLIPALVNFILIIFYARVLSESEYGKYALLLATSSFLSTFGYTWIKMYVQRYYQSFSIKNNLSYIINTIKTNYIIVSLIILITMLLIGIFIKSLYAVNWLLILLIIFLTLVTPILEVILIIYRARLKSNIYSSILISKSILNLAFAVIFVYFFKMGIVGVFLSLIIAHLLVITKVFLVEDKKYLVVSKNTFIYNREFLAYGTPFIFTFLLNFFITLSDRFFIGYFEGADAVGVFSVANDIASQSLIMLFMLANLAAYPLIVKEIELKRLDKVIEKTKQYATISMSVAIPATLGFIMLAPELSSIIVKNKYGESFVLILQITALSTFILGLKLYFSDISFQLGKNSKMQVYPNIIGSILNIILNFIFIPFYGVIGALISSLITYTTILIISIILGRRIFKLHVNWLDLLKVTFAASLMALVLSFISYQGNDLILLLIKLLVGLLVYIVVYFILNILNIRSLLLNKFNK